jgi:hypothetical protein
MESHAPALLARRYAEAVAGSIYGVRQKEEPAVVSRRLSSCWELTGCQEVTLRDRKMKEGPREHQPTARASLVQEPIVPIDVCNR